MDDGVGGTCIHSTPVNTEETEATSNPSRFTIKNKNEFFINDWRLIFIY